ncbi:hypothetical protein WJX72_005063 [[Myrmecia] bisecta]|uniref:Uncharacterized protein n=1 Tax=[Myrmecia] bisecta TaxID=41462 RepID=A0AAW1P4E1_9CHLO
MAAAYVLWSVDTYAKHTGILAVFDSFADAELAALREDLRMRTAPRRALQASTSKAQCCQVYGGVLGVSGVFKVHQVSMTALISVFLGDSSDQHPASPFDANTSAAVVLKELQKTEVGTLKKETGVTVTEESGSLPAGAYRFYRAQSGASNTQWDIAGLCDDLSLFAKACQVPEVQEQILELRPASTICLRNADTGYYRQEMWNALITQ